jgi:hypothetical protein
VPLQRGLDQQQQQQVQQQHQIGQLPQQQGLSRDASGDCAVAGMFEATSESAAAAVAHVTTVVVRLCVRL